MTFNINYLRDAKTVEDLGNDPIGVLTDWEDWVRQSGIYSTSITLTGGTPKNSTMGRLVRLGWVSATVVCADDCWNLHCPTPDKHGYRFQLTSVGRGHAALLLKEDADQ